MKIMTLNTHAWLEADDQVQISNLATWIAQEDYGVVGLQEVNQGVDAVPLAADDLEAAGYQEASLGPIQDADLVPVIKGDNFAYVLVQKLADLGLTYYWTWLPSHLSYGVWEEGLAILSKEPLDEIQGYLLTPDYPFTTFKRRVALAGRVEETWYYSCHMSWWDQGFQEELAALAEALPEPLVSTVVMGDFNNQPQLVGEGYDQVLALGLVDAYTKSYQQDGSYTVGSEIDGWRGDAQAKRIDYIFLTPDLAPVSRYQVVLDGRDSPVVSDHFGLAITI